jgi:hypothetical protein
VAGWSAPADRSRATPPSWAGAAARVDAGRAEKALHTGAMDRDHRLETDPGSPAEPGSGLGGIPEGCRPRSGGGSADRSEPRSVPSPAVRRRSRRRPPPPRSGRVRVGIIGTPIPATSTYDAPSPSWGQDDLLTKDRRSATFCRGAGGAPVGNDPPGGTRRNFRACSLRDHLLTLLDPAFLPGRRDRAGPRALTGTLIGQGPLCPIELIVSTSGPCW